MPPNINIKFYGNDQGVYFSGKVVSGKVEITFPKPKKVRGIAIKISGYAKTHWNDKDVITNTTIFNRTRIDASDYSGYEEYISAITYLVGSDDAPPTEISPGLHTYNFACALPALAPSSFEGTHGHIRYMAKVILERPWKYDQTYAVGFTVLKSVDLNHDSPLLKIPAEFEVMKKFGCGICKSNPIHMKVRLSQTGFVPGQIIPIQVEISNAITMDFPEIRFYLRKLIVYNADTPTSKTKEEIVELNCKNSGHVEGDSQTKFEENLLIPAVPPTDLLHSKIIQISYDIQVQIAIGQRNESVFLTCPIVIGTAPLITENQKFSEESLSKEKSKFEKSASNFDSENRSENGTSSATNTNNNIPPPSYEESVNMPQGEIDDEEEHSIQRTYFVPRYPVFHFNTTEASS